MENKEIQKTNDPLKDMIPLLTSGTDLEVIIKNGTQVSKLRRENPATLVKVVVILLEKLINFFKTKRGLETQDEIIDLAELIITEFWYLKVEELAYCFNHAKLGKYDRAIYDDEGKLILADSRILDRLDGSIIITWIRKYDVTDKVKHAETKAQEHKKEETGSNLPIVAAILEKMKPSLPDAKEEKAKEDNFAAIKAEWVRNKAVEKQELAREESKVEEPPKKETV